MDPNLQASYESFMLGGSGGKRNDNNNSSNKKKKKQQPQLGRSQLQPSQTPPPSSSLRGNTRSTTDSRSSGKKKNVTTSTNKDIRPIFKAFQSRVNEYCDSSVYGCNVLESISHLRDRLFWETKQLATLRNDDNNDNDDSGGNVDWRGYGFRPSSSTTTTKDRLIRSDIELALDHDLLEHERMMTAVRGAVASMAQTVDAIGRRLDEWMMYELDHQRQQQYLESDYSNDTDNDKWNSLLTLCQRLYVVLSEDLYMKQMAVNDIIESYHDGVVAMEEEEEEEEKNSNGRSTIHSSGTTTNVGNVISSNFLHGNPRSVARTIVRDWKRTLVVDQNKQEREYSSKEQQITSSGKEKNDSTEIQSLLTYILTVVP